MKPISMEVHAAEQGTQFVLRLPDGVLAGKLCGVTEGGGETATLSLGELARQVLAVEDSYISKSLEEAKKRGESVSCREGCAACCRQLVTASVPEACALLDAIEALPDKERQGAEERFADTERRLQEAGLLEPVESINEPSLDGESHYHLASRVYRLGASCPLLESGRCVAYAERPVACREYYVTSPAEACSDPFVNMIRSVRLGVSLRDTLASFCADVLRSELELVPLPLLMRWGRRREGIRLRRWNARRLAETFLAHLEYVAHESRSADM